ncbi:hypothetical protein GGR55DRAFT_303929 [Xylaria sp. FL0064]|nr:hypothetical protein GGR55DRAFT_303929 [Xylaria sp. FL0064]
MRHIPCCRQIERDLLLFLFSFSFRGIYTYRHIHKRFNPASTYWHLSCLGYHRRLDLLETAQWEQALQHHHCHYDHTHARPPSLAWPSVTGPSAHDPPGPVSELGRIPDLIGEQASSCFFWRTSTAQHTTAGRTNRPEGLLTPRFIIILPRRYTRPHTTQLTQLTHHHSTGIGIPRLGTRGRLPLSIPRVVCTASGTRMNERSHEATRSLESPLNTWLY